MSHRPTFANHLKSLGRTIFRDNRIDEICPENPGQQLCFSVCRFLPTELCQAISHGFPSVHHMSTLPARSLTELTQAISHRFPSVHPVVASVSLLSKRARPELFPTVSRPSTLSSLPSRSLPKELAPSYFPRFPFRPPCRRFRIAPSQRWSSPQAISHGFPSVHPVVASISLPPTELSPSISHGFLSVHPAVSFVSLLPNGALPKLFPTVTLRPPSRRFRRRCFWEKKITCQVRPKWVCDAAYFFWKFELCLCFTPDSNALGDFGRYSWAVNLTHGWRCRL